MHNTRKETQTKKNQKIKILCLDDEDLILEMLGILLSKFGNIYTINPSNSISTFSNTKDYFAKLKKSPATLYKQTLKSRISTGITTELPPIHTFNIIVCDGYLGGFTIHGIEITWYLKENTKAKIILYSGNTINSIPLPQNKLYSEKLHKEVSYIMKPDQELLERNIQNIIDQEPTKQIPIEINA